MGVNPDTGQIERTWERYATVEFVDADRDGAEILGTVPLYYDAVDELTYARRYTFGDDSVDVEVVVTNATGAEQSLDALWENVNSA